MKPVKIVPLINSITPNKSENRKSTQNISRSKRQKTNVIRPKIMQEKGLGLKQLVSKN